MASATVISGNELNFENFSTAEKKYQKIIDLLKTAGLEEALGTSTRIYSKLVREFYRNGVYTDGILSTNVKGVQLSLRASEVNLALGFNDGGLTTLTLISTDEGLKRMHHKKNPELKGLKKKEFPQKYEFLADVVGKCIMCKDSAHDSVSDVQLRIMTAIVKRIELNFGALLLEWIGNWVQNGKKTKGTRKMFYGRFISIILQSALGDKIEDNEGEALNANKRITQKLFDNWKRNPVENRRFTQSEDSEMSRSEAQRGSLNINMSVVEEHTAEVNQESPMLIRKSKGKQKLNENPQDEETQGLGIEESEESADPPTVHNLFSSAIPTSMQKKRKSTDEETDESKGKTKGKRSKRSKRVALSTVEEYSQCPIVESRVNEATQQVPHNVGEADPTIATSGPDNETPRADSESLNDSQTEVIEAIVASIHADSRNVHVVGEASELRASPYAPVEGETSEQYAQMRTQIVDESEDDEIEIVAISRDEQRHTSYHCLYKFLPMMPFHRALVHNVWNQLFWTFHAYPNVTALAQGYPEELNFAQKLITNSSSSVNMLKVCFVPLHFVSIHNPSPQFNCFDSPTPPVVESLNSTTDDPVPNVQNIDLTCSTIDCPIVECVQANSTSSPIPSPEQVRLPQRPPLFRLALGDIPSTSCHESFDVPRSMGGLHADENSEGILKEILDKISQIPTIEGLTDLTVHLETEIHDDIATSSSELHTRMDNIINAANHLPGNLGKELTNRMREMFKTVSESLQSRDALFLKEIAKHRATVEILQSTNDKSIALLSQQVFEMKSLLRDHLYSSDSAIARLQALQEQADARFQDHRSDVSASQTQMQELIQSIQVLSDKVGNVNDGGKGGNTERDDMGRYRGKGGRGERGGRARGSRMIQTSIYPPRFEVDQNRASSQRVSSSSTFRPSASHSLLGNPDMERWHQEIAIKEEEAILREEMELGREEEERREQLRKIAEERKERQRR